MSTAENDMHNQIRIFLTDELKKIVSRMLTPVHPAAIMLNDEAPGYLSHETVVQLHKALDKNQRIRIAQQLEGSTAEEFSYLDYSADDKMFAIVQLKSLTSRLLAGE